MKAIARIQGQAEGGVAMAQHIMGVLLYSSECEFGTRADIL